MAVRRGAGAVERGSLENCWPFTGPVSSNLTPAVQLRQPASSVASRHLDERSVPGEIRAAAPRRPGRPDGRRADRRLVHFRCRPAAASPASDHAAHADAPDGDRPARDRPPVTTPVVTTPAVTTPTLPVPPQAPPAPRVPRRDAAGLAASSIPASERLRTCGGRPERATRPIREGGPRRAGNRPPGSVSLVTGSLSAERTESGGQRSCSSFGGRHSSSSSSSRWRPTAGASDVSVYGATGESTVFGSPTGSVANHWRPGRTGSWRERFRPAERSDARGSSSSIARAEARSERPGEPTRARKARVSGASDPARPPAGALSVPARPKSARHPARHHGVLGARFAKVAFFAAERRSALGLRPARASRSRCSERRRLSRRPRPWACPRRSSWVS